MKVSSEQRLPSVELMLKDEKFAAQIGTGTKATRATGYATMRQGQNLLNLPKSAATTRRGLRAGWTCWLKIHHLLLDLVAH